MANVGNFLELMVREAYDHPPEPLIARQWVQDRYQSVLERAPWHFLIKEATFSTVAEITAGTVTVTLGSATVSETTTNANGWTSAIEGRYFRKDGDSEFYPIDTFTNGTPDTATLNRVYGQATATTAAYTIFQRFYALATDARMITSMTVIDSPTPMMEVSQTEIDWSIQNRPAMGNPPRFWAQAGRDSADSIRIEIYPIPDEAHGILYHYIEETPSLADQDTNIIPQVNFSLLRAGWLANYWSWRTSQDDAPIRAMEYSIKFEREFEARLREMEIRECGNFPVQRIKSMPRHWRHRGDKFGRRGSNLLLP